MLLDRRLTPNQRTRLESPVGLQLEVRTHNGLPGYLEIWLDGAFVEATTDDRQLAGPHVGLFASTPWGRVFFQNRSVFDVGIEAVIRYSPWSGGVVSDIVVRTFAGRLLSRTPSTGRTCRRPS